MFPVGLSLGVARHNEENFAALAKSGITHIEVAPAYSNYQKLDFPKLKEFSRRYGIKLWSFHLPFSGPDTLDIASTNEELRCRSIELWRMLIQKGAEIGIDKFVAHPSSEPKSEDERREAEIGQAQKSLFELAEIAAGAGAIIAVEDLPRSCLGSTTEEFLRLLEADSRLRICFDTNHLLYDSHQHFFEKTKGKIATVHISDYDFINERHWICGEGKIDWQLILKGLGESGYQGPWLYEVGLLCPKTIIRDRNLTFEDFYQNAHEIFAGKAPASIGKPKENLGMWE